MNRLSPPHASMGFAVTSLVTAILLLFIIGTIGGTVRSGITSSELSNISLAILILSMLASAVVFLTAIWSFSSAIRASSQTRAGAILEARASAEAARQNALVTIGLALAVAIAFALTQLVLLNDGNIQRTFPQWQLMRDRCRTGISCEHQAGADFAGDRSSFWSGARSRAGAPLRFMAVAYIDLMRAVPAIIVLYLIGFGLPLANLPVISGLSPDWVAIMALSLTYSAYVAEIYRSGIASSIPLNGRHRVHSGSATFRHWILQRSGLHAETLNARMGH